MAASGTRGRALVLCGTGRGRASDVAGTMGSGAALLGVAVRRREQPPWAWRPARLSGACGPEACGPLPGALDGAGRRPARGCGACGQLILQMGTQKLLGTAERAGSRRPRALDVCGWASGKFPLRGGQVPAPAPALAPAPGSGDGLAGAHDGAGNAAGSAGTARHGVTGPCSCPVLAPPFSSR